jgi:hypothetical protein
MGYFDLGRDLGVVYAPGHLGPLGMFQLTLEPGDLSPIPRVFVKPDLQALLVEELFSNHLIKGLLLIARGCFSAMGARKPKAKVLFSYGRAVNLGYNLPFCFRTFRRFFLGRAAPQNGGENKTHEKQKEKFFQLAAPRKKHLPQDGAKA